jgi:glycerophosphoryl diester phosphodiesterase
MREHGTRRIGLFLAAALALGLCPGAGRLQASPWPGDRPITVGHRGTRVLADENTLPAFQSASDHGLDLFECDPRLTKDGVYVIMHDEKVDRTTDGHGRVSDMTLEEIKKLRTPSGQEVPTLLEALQFAAEHNMGVYLDVKSPPPDGGDKLIEAIEAAGMTDRVIVGCWQAAACKMVEKKKPEISTCISWPWPALTLKQAKKMGADAVGTLRGLASAPAIKRAHQLGLKMITMPINRAAEIEKYEKRGLDGLQSDDPRLLQSHGRPPGNGD